MKQTSFLLFFFGIGLIYFQSCTHNVKSPGNTPGTGGKTRESVYGNDESKTMSGKCLSCHKSGGTGDGIYTIGGTVYKEDQITKYPNIDIKFYTGPNGTGTLVKTLQVDGVGNFYSTKSLDLSLGLYPAVDNKNGQVEYMNQKLTTGDCNSCHNSNPTDYININ